MDDIYEKMISRQVEIINKQEQDKIRNMPVCVVGCGGLGGTIIEQLVRTGFENITIIDGDVFDLTNLNRQIRSNLESIGDSKSGVTKQAMLKINPNLNIVAYDVIIDEDNLGDLIADSKIVIDAVDNVLTRVIISRECKKRNIVFVHCAVDETMGQLSVFDGSGPSYEELFNLKSVNKELDSQVVEYLSNLSSRKPQVLGVLPSIFASLQVNETVKYILGKSELLSPRVLMWNIFDLESFRIIDF